jgi:signal transduction histidine kinase/ActR/RegA family two-component response regulator
MVERAFAAIASEQRDCRLEYRLRKRDGSYAWMIDRGTPYYGENGEALGYVEAVLDISDHKVAETAAEEARRAAEGASRTKSQFLAAASHDLRQPLNAMSLLLGSLHGEVAGDRGRLLLGRLRESLDAAVNLLNALLDLSKLENGIIEVHAGPVPAADIFGQLAAEYTGEAALKGLDLRFVPSRQAVWTDAVLFTPLLSNLISNAIRHTARGRVLVGGRRRGGTFRIDVLDTGPGIPMGEVDRIFEAFHQLGNSERSRRSGHGLGLAIVRRTAELLGHRLTVLSELGRGSCFSVEVPLANAAAATPRQPADDAFRPISGTCRVLLIEDDPLVREAMQWALEDLGCTVRVAVSMAETLDLVDRLDPHLILADYRLPGNYDGLDAIHEVRRRIGRDIAACLITGELAQSIRTRAERSGVHWLAKPIGPEDLRAAVERACPSPQGERAMGAAGQSGGA